MEGAESAGYHAGLPCGINSPAVVGGLDIYLLKQYPSAFFGTPLSTILRHRGVDTVLIMGVTTSGCVRASIIDSFSYGFKTIVVEDSCGDQEAGPHEDNMRDVSRRYADLISSADAVSRLESLSP